MYCDALDLRLNRLTQIAAAFGRGEAGSVENHVPLPDWPRLARRGRLTPELGRRVATVAAAALVAPHALTVAWSVLGRAKQPSFAVPAPAATPFSPATQDGPATMTDAAPDYGG